MAAGGWVRMGAGFSHTSQGDCELISTLEREDESEGEKVRRKESSKGEK